MKKIKIQSGLDKVLEGLPDSWGVFAFYRQDECLYYCKSGNLRFRLLGMYQRKDSDSLLSELFLEADTISFNVYAEPLMALIDEKVFLSKHSSLFQQRLWVWKAYPYLAFNAYQYPFIKVCDQPNDDWQYIGPFRSRFFLADVIDTYAKLLKIPNCDGASYPCDRRQNGTCNAYCLALEEGNGNDLDKLDCLLKEAFVHPNNGILELVQKEKQRYFDELAFDKVDLLNDETELLAKYRDWLSFLYVAKDLEYEDELCQIKDGLLHSAVFRGKSYRFTHNKTEYRTNEALALNKEQVDECRILYSYIKKHR